MISLAIGLALAISIAIGRVRKINIGLVAIPFAYIIGAFFMHIKPSDVIDLWPSHIFFAILAISLFFGFAMANGTLAEIANGLLYRFRAAPVMLPVMIFLVSVLFRPWVPGTTPSWCLWRPLLSSCVARSGSTRSLVRCAPTAGAGGVELYGRPQRGDFP